MNRYPSEAARGWYSEEEQGTNPFRYHSSYAYRDGQKFSVETVDGFKSKIWWPRVWTELWHSFPVRECCLSVVLTKVGLQYTLGKSSNRSPENFNILAKIRNIQKIPIFQRQVYYTRGVLSNFHFDRSIYSVSIAIKRWLPWFCKNHT